MFDKGDATMKDRLDYLNNIKNSGLINEIYEYMLKNDDEFREYVNRCNIESCHEIVTDFSEC